jgi:hypothetical protein
MGTAQLNIGVKKGPPELDLLYRDILDRVQNYINEDPEKSIGEVRGEILSALIFSAFSAFDKKDVDTARDHIIGFTFVASKQIKDGGVST